MSKPFQTTQQNVSRHAKNIFADSALVESSTVKESLTVQIEGKREVQRALQLYNLDFALSGNYQTREKDKRRGDIPVRQAGWITRAPMKGLSSVVLRAKGELLEGIGV